MAIDGVGGAGRDKRADRERPGRKSILSNVAGTITDTIAVGVRGATILLDETSLVGALWRQTKK
jgi:hypothetical protein